MIRTLIVDDHEDVREINREFVARVPSFVVVGVARNGREALAVVDSQPVDLVLLDFYLPDMSGLDVCYALRNPRRPLVDIIAVTSANDTDTMRALRAYGAEFLIKPYRFAYFREKLEAYAKYHHGLPSGQKTSQCELDDLVDKLRVTRAAALPKGLTPATYKLVIDVLRNADRPLTATEIAQATGTSLTRTTARRYLLHLHEQRLVERTARFGTGRPEHCYQWAKASGN